MKGSGLPTFNTPSVKEKFGSGRLFGRVSLNRGLTVVKKAGFYTSYSAPDPAVFDGSDAVYLGGHTYQVTDAEALSLTIAGYGASITGDPNGYGLGPYGSGAYGL